MKASMKHLWFAACALAVLVGCCLCAADNNARVYRYRGFNGIWAGHSHEGESLLENFFASWSFDADPFVARIITPDYDLTKVTTPIASTGKLGNAARVGSDRGYLTTSGQQNSALKMAGGVFWISCWIKQTQAPNGNSLKLFQKTTLGDNAGYYALVGANNSLSWLVGDGSSFVSITASDPIVIDTWYFLTFQCVSGSKLYLRISTEAAFGTLQEVAFATYSINSANQLVFGSLSDAQSHEMLIDEANMGGKALTESEERWMWNSGVGRTYPFVP